VPEFLLEIGVEEMPASWLPGLTEQVRQRFQELARDAQLVPERVESFSTPRRLVVTAGVVARQGDSEEHLWGPAAKIARDPSGKWTRAAEGFAKKFGVSPDELVVAVKGSAGIVGGMPAAPLVEPSEQYLLHIRKITGRPAAEVLPAVLANLLRGLAFPKRMSWDAWLEDGKGRFPFGRPIRWLIVLLDGNVVPFTIHETVKDAKGPAIVESGAKTRGHRFLPRGRSNAQVEVSSWSDYRQKLHDHCVIVEPEERDKAIRDQLGKGGATTVHDFGLLDEWKHLVEWPTIVFGRIPEEFRQLPTEVLQTVLVHHQKYIPLGEGEHVMRFAALTNADRAAEAEIVRGMERVVVARLRDGAFFFAEDMKRPLADRVPDLSGVTFHQRLGTYAEKAERMVRLVDTMAEGLGILTKPERETAREAARLAKADLTTLMVREFPELQGVMGGIYLRAQGHPQANVAEVVRWHYHPVSIDEDSLPARVFGGSDATVFGAVSLADKLDTLAGYFGLGIEPTGSSDPFSLRRAAHGVVRVLIDFWKAAEDEARPNLSELIRLAVEGFQGSLNRPVEKVIEPLEMFFLDRIEYVFGARGFSADEVEACVYSDPSQVGLSGNSTIRALTDLKDCYVRLQALHRIRRELPEDFRQLARAFKRANNIVLQAGNEPGLLLGFPWSNDPEDYPAGPERNLLLKLESIARPGPDRLESEEQGYIRMFRFLATIRPEVDAFFDGVMVMADDPADRRRRLHLMQRTVAPFYRIADISRLGG
jgi:glycyl-tRNA synthetase beta chain